MAARSIGVLSAIITADSTAFMKEFSKIDNRLARSSKSFTEPGAKLALGFLGVENALKAVSNEVRYVINNVEKIPGVPAETVASIITMRDNLAAAKGWIDRMTAGIVAFGVQSAQAVGAGAAGLMGFDDTSGLSRQESPDAVARSLDPAFDAKIDAARKKLADASKAAAFATQNEVQQIVSLRAEAERYETFAKSNSIDSVQQLAAKTAAQEKLKDAANKMAAMNKQLADSEKEVAAAMTGAYTATVSRSEAIAGLEDKSGRLFAEMAGVSKDPNDPEAIKQRIELNQQLADTQKRLGDLYKEAGKTGREFGEAISSSFEDAVFQGGKLGDILKGLAMDLARILFRNAVTAPLAKSMGAFFGGFFADGGRPPLGKVSVVGERGPELFIPDTAGRIIPNSRLGSSAGSGATYHIDARGGDEAAFARLETVIRQLNGSIERRAVGAVISARSRGGSLAAALG